MRDVARVSRALAQHVVRKARAEKIGTGGIVATTRVAAIVAIFATLAGYPHLGGGPLDNLILGRCIHLQDVPPRQARSEGRPGFGMERVVAPRMHSRTDQFPGCPYST